MRMYSRSAKHNNEFSFGDSGIDSDDGDTVKNDKDKSKSKSGREPETGDSSMPLATAGLICGMLYIAEMFREDKLGITEKQKKDIIRKIIGKTKGKNLLIRMLGLSLIFMILAFYYLIGKKADKTVNESMAETV